MAKNISVGEIVSVKTMMEIAKIVRQEAAKIAKQKKAALASKRDTPNVYNPNLIGIKSPRTTQNQISIDLTLSEVAMAFEHGSAPHPISAKNKPLLVFEGTNQWAGQIIQIQSVNHPGFAKRPFLEPAKRKTASKRKELLEKEAGKNIRTIISGMKRVI